VGVVAAITLALAGYTALFVPKVRRNPVRLAALAGLLAALVLAACYATATQPGLIALTGVDTPGDPGSTPPSAAASPAESSGPFDIPRGDVGEDEDILTPSGRRRTATQRELDALPIGSIPDPLRGTPLIAPEVTGRDAEEVLAKMLPGRSDSPYDWYAPVEPLHVGCEPYALPPCVPPPPCHPSEPPQPYDLVGLRGVPSGGPIYRGPCNPRTGTHDHCHFAWYHRLHDRFFDCFYRWK
jgi:hypothetical protein